MHGIDPPTLVIVVSFLALLLAVVLAAMRASFPRTIDGIGLWAVAIPLFVFSSVLFSRQQTHPAIHVMLANSIFLLGLLLMNAGMRRFYGLATPRPQVTAAAAAAILAMLAWFTFVLPSFTIRLAVMSAVGALLFGHLCWLPQRHGRRSLGSVITSFAFGLTAASCLLRMASVVSNLDRPSRLLDLGTLQAIYLTSFNVSLLIGSVGFILLINERLRDILEFNASHDALTGVLNRGAFFRQAGTAFDQSRRQSTPLSVALVDLDHFKQINDLYGHAIGDRVLQDFCRAVLAELRPIDTLGRYGGEEFVILLPGMTREDALAMGRRLSATLLPGTGLPSYTVSLGVATVDPDTADIDELLISADKALYRAKKNGRNRVEEWRHGDEDPLEEPFPSAASPRHGMARGA